MVVALTQWGCRAEFEQTGGLTLEVDAVEGKVVRAFSPAGGHALILARSALPARIREGDVVVDGHTDPALEAELRAEVSRARRTLGAPEHGSFDLEDAPPPAVGSQAREPSPALPRPVKAPPRAGHSPSLTEPVEP